MITKNAMSSTIPEKKFSCDFKDCIYNPEHCRLPLCKEFDKFKKTTSMYRNVADCEAGLTDTHMSTRFETELDMECECFSVDELSEIT